MACETLICQPYHDGSARYYFDSGVPACQHVCKRLDKKRNTSRTEGSSPRWLETLSLSPASWCLSTRTRHRSQKHSACLAADHSAILRKTRPGFSKFVCPSPRCGLGRPSVHLTEPAPLLWLACVLSKVPRTAEVRIDIEKNSSHTRPHWARPAGD